MTSQNIFIPFNFESAWIFSPKHLPKIYRTVYDYRHGNFTALKSSLERLNLSDLISANGDINDEWCTWKDTFLTTVKSHIPTAKLRSRNHIPLMTSDILHNIKKKNTLRRKHQRAPDSLDIKEKFKHQRSVVKKMLRDSRARYINSICSDVGSNSKRFWSLFKLKSKSCNVPQSVSMTIDEDIRTYSETPPKIANLFNKYFTSVFTTDSDISEDLFANNDILSCSSTDSSHMENIVLEPEHVTIILRSLDTNKAHGPDEIPARLLTETATQIAPSLCKLFNKSLSTGVVPRDWKLADVVLSIRKETSNS